jgi:hypothetical protein
MSCRLKRAALSVMVAAFAVAFAAAADAQSTGSGGADAQRTNHLNHDRWARSDSGAPPSKHDDSDDHHDSHDSDNHPATSGPHKGELNGKLHMGDW